MREVTVQPAKMEALETIGRPPDVAYMDEIMYRLYVLDHGRKECEDICKKTLSQ